MKPKLETLPGIQDVVSNVCSQSQCVHHHGFAYFGVPLICKLHHQGCKDPRQCLDWRDKRKDND